jgi:hypothetical protein
MSAEAAMSRNRGSQPIGANVKRSISRAQGAESCFALMPVRGRSGRNPLAVPPLPFSIRVRGVNDDSELLLQIQSGDDRRSMDDALAGR